MCGKLLNEVRCVGDIHLLWPLSGQGAVRHPVAPELRNGPSKVLAVGCGIREVDLVYRWAVRCRRRATSVPWATVRVCRILMEEESAEAQRPDPR